MEETRNLLDENLQIEERMGMHLNETANWARFLGITGYIIGGLLVICAFIIPNMTYGSYSYSSRYDTMKAVLTVTYLLAGLLLFFVALFTYKFGNNIKQALNMKDHESLNTGLKNLKFLFRLYGILTIIYLGVIILSFLFTALK